MKDPVSASDGFFLCVCVVFVVVVVVCFYRGRVSFFVCVCLLLLFVFIGGGFLFSGTFLYIHTLGSSQI